MEENLFDEFPEEIQNGLHDIIKNQLNKKNPTIRVAPASKSGIVYRLICRDEEKNYEYSFFIKIAPTDEAKRQMYHINKSFLREIYVYEAVLPYFREFQKSRDVHSGGFDEYSKIYKSFATEPTECLVLQDMAQQHFVMIDQTDVTVENMLLVMKTLGKFHAISFAAKDQEPHKFFEIVNQLNEVLFAAGNDSTLSLKVKKAANTAIDCITDDKDAHLIKALLDLYETNQFDLIVNLVNGNASEPYSVILHGDMWSNNTMFKYHENTLHDICFIDWQDTRYGSPVLDLMHYIFCSTTRESRGRNYNTYLKTYHESLSNLLIRLGSDPEKLFPYSALQDQLQKFGKYGLVWATIALPILVSEVDLPESSEYGGSKTCNELSVEFKKRLRDIVADVYRLGYI